MAALRKSNSGNYVQKKKKLISVDSDGNLLKKIYRKPKKSNSYIALIVVRNVI